jgi:hypothetical protein
VHSYDDLQTAWKGLRGSGNLAIREVACAGAARTMLCGEAGDHAAPAITISAGVHGDEPAGPLALLALVTAGELDRRYAYRLWPCLNPSGFSAGTRENAEGTDINRSFGRGGQTPEARAVITANRDRKFVLSIDLHEDCDANGFYCYEYGAGDVGEAVAAAVRQAGYPLEEEGVLRPDPAVEMQAIGGLSYTLAIVRRASPRALTFETPARLDCDSRVEIHSVAVKAAITHLSNLNLHA